MHPLWRAGINLEALRLRTPNTMVEHLGIELTELGPDFLTGTMPVDHRTCQPMRLLHGGASLALAETLGSIAAMAALTSDQDRCVGQEINANHLRRVDEGGMVTGTARAFHIGTNSQVWGIEIVNERAQRVCVARLTVAVIRGGTARSGRTTPSE